MGRGRQKAKQTKVARKLKYFSPDTDLDALQRELAAGHEAHSEEQQTDEDDLYARYADYAEDDHSADDDHWDDEDYWTSPSSQSRK